MLTANRDIMTSARDKLRGKWGIALHGFLHYGRQ